MKIFVKSMRFKSVENKKSEEIVLIFKYWSWGNLQKYYDDIYMPVIKNIESEFSIEVYNKIKSLGNVYGNKVLWRTY
jgi:hypothetical protein